MKRLAILLLMLLWLAPAAWAAPGLQVGARIDQSEDPLPFGKPATLVLSLSWDEGWPFQPPAVEDLDLAGFTVIDRFVTDATLLGPGRQGTVYNIVFTRFEPGKASVPAVEFTTPSGPVQSPKLTLTYKGAEPLKGDKPDELRGPKEALELSTRDWWIWLAKVLGAVLLALLILSILVRHLGFLERWLSPRARALRQLGRLEKALEKGTIAPPVALLDLVEVTRLYLARAYGLVTREATSTEIAQQMTVNNRCQSIKPAARTILERGDAAKFAQREPSGKETSDLVEGLRSALAAEKRKP